MNQLREDQLNSISVPLSQELIDAVIEFNRGAFSDASLPENLRDALEMQDLGSPASRFYEEVIFGDRLISPREWQEAPSVAQEAIIRTLWESMLVRDEAREVLSTESDQQHLVTLIDGVITRFCSGRISRQLTKFVPDEIKKMLLAKDGSSKSTLLMALNPTESITARDSEHNGAAGSIPLFRISQLDSSENRNVYSVTGVSVEEMEDLLAEKEVLSPISTVNRTRKGIAGALRKYLLETGVSQDVTKKLVEVLISGTDKRSKVGIDTISSWLPNASAEALLPDMMFLLSMNIKFGGITVVTGISPEASQAPMVAAVIESSPALVVVKDRELVVITKSELNCAAIAEKINNIVV